MFAFTTTTTERKGGIVITISQRGLEPKKCSSKSVETKGRRLMNEPMGQRRLTYFVRGSIAVRLTSTLTSLDLHKLAKLRLIQVKEDSRIQIKKHYFSHTVFLPVKWEFSGGSITARLTSTLTCLDLIKQLNLFLTKFAKQPNPIKKGGQPYSDTSTYAVSKCSLDEGWIEVAMVVFFLLDYSMWFSGLMGGEWEMIT